MWSGPETPLSSTKPEGHFHAPAHPCSLSDTGHRFAGRANPPLKLVVFTVRARNLPPMQTAAPCADAARPPDRPTSASRHSRRRRRSSNFGRRCCPPAAGAVAVPASFREAAAPAGQTEGGRPAISPGRRGSEELARSAVPPVVHSLAQFCTLTNSVGIESGRKGRQ